MIEQIKSLSYEDIKSKYGAYLESLDISKNTRYTACTDAFYLWRKRGKEAFWEVVLSDDFEAVCKKELTAILTSETGAASSVSSYVSHLRRFRKFIYEGSPNDTTIKPSQVKSSVKRKSAKQIPVPCENEVRRYLARWDTLENYRLQEDALNKLFFELCPENNDIVSVLLKCSTLNDFYSTNIFSIYPVAKHILSLDIDERLKAGDVTLVRDIQFIEISGKQRNFYSFATKYCSHHNPVDYPIYDSYVDAVLRYFQKTDGFMEFSQTDLKDYAGFKNILKGFQKRYKLEAFSLKQIDQYIWQLGKEFFPKKY